MIMLAVMSIWMTTRNTEIERQKRKRKGIIWKNLFVSISNESDFNTKQPSQSFPDSLAVKARSRSGKSFFAFLAAKSLSR